MALVCLYLRKTQLFPSGSPAWVDGALAAAAVVDSELLFSLPGFIMALTTNGKYVYISENVSNFLGFSVVELLVHGDSIFDLLNGLASRTMQEKLSFAQQHPGTVLTFVAFCTPVANLSESGDHTFQKLSFQSLHTLDMKIAEVTESVIYHLGYHKEELIHQSWYSFLHPEDLTSAAELHRDLVHDAEECSQDVIVRMLCKDLRWAWVQVIASRENGQAGELVICTNHILSEEEALHIQSQKPQPTTFPPSTLRQCTKGTEQQTQPNEINVFPQEPVMPRDRILQYDRCQILDACAKKILPVPLQPSLPTILPIPDSANMQLPQESGLFPFPDDWHKNLSCTDRVKRLPPSSPCTLCSPESTLFPANSLSADFSSLPSSTERFPATDTGPDPYRWAISMLADQIHSLAETFSQYTKQIPQEIPTTISLWPSQPPENFQTNGALNVMEELSVDEEIITTILNNLFDNSNFNLSSSELGSAHNVHRSDSETQLSLLQTSLTEASPCLNQCPFQRPLSFSTSADSCVPDSQWDERFHITFYQGAHPEEAMFS
uniref:Uncharacterized protein n=1 Tax=Sphaerodactylus townsendi TaxID=933632 RepID=A0ACB8G9T7_9SAUR